MKRLVLVAAISALFSLTACEKDKAIPLQAPVQDEIQAVKSIGVSYNQLIDNIALPMKQKIRDDGGQAMAGNIQNADGGAVILYAAIDNNMISLSRVIVMPSAKGNLPSDADNLNIMLQFLKNTSQNWNEGKDWFVSAFKYAHENPNKEVNNTYLGNDYMVMVSPELNSFELSVKPH